MDFLNQAIQAAQKSSYKNKHGAVISYAGRLLSVGYNKAWASSSLMASTGIHMIHAEIDALSKIKYSTTKPTTLLVVRIGSQGLMESRPCERCLEQLYLAGVRKIYFSRNGKIERLSIWPDMKQPKFPSGLKMSSKFYGMYPNASLLGNITRDEQGRACS